jgi:uncharacterized protein (DUF1800 family)
MKRREFITNLTDTSAPIRDKINPGDVPRTLSTLAKKTSPLSWQDALHLLRRFSFSPTFANIIQIVGKTPSEAVDIIIGTSPQTPITDVTDEWATKPEEDPLKQIVDIRGQIEGRLKGRFVSFTNWLTEQIKNEKLPFREKIALFWSTVWCIEFTYDTLGMMPPPLLLKNNQTLRQLSVGNYKDMAQAMTLDGAMLLYQSLYYSTGKKPNENYMRELMELFTMGIGNYTEGDIKEGSRVLTGWRTAPYWGDPGLKGYFNTYFSPNDHDITSKTFMGETIPARDPDSNTEDQVLDGEVKLLLNIIFTKRSDAISKFIAEKIYRYFVYSNPGGNDDGVILEIANLLKSSNFDLLPVFKAIASSEHFYDTNNFGVQIKTPPEFIITFQNQLGVNYANSRNAIFDLEQELYDPPNVGSWKAYRTWESTRTYPLRVKYAREILTQATDSGLTALGLLIPDSVAVASFVKALCDYLLPISPDASRLDFYKGKLLEGAKTDEAGWSGLIGSSSPNVGAGMRAVIANIIKAPDFQLC